MTFLELQKKIVQTRKKRSGIKNKNDYFEDNEPFFNYCQSVYKKALNAANQVVQHCMKKKEIEPFIIVWGKPQKENNIDEKKYLDLLKDTAKYEKWWKESAAKLSQTETELEELKIKYRALEAALKKSNIGGRHKDKAKEDNIVTYKLANKNATVREIAEALGVATATVQKTLVANGLNNKRKK